MSMTTRLVRWSAGSFARNGPASRLPMINRVTSSAWRASQSLATGPSLPLSSGGPWASSIFTSATLRDATSSAAASSGASASSPSSPPPPPPDMGASLDRIVPQAIFQSSEDGKMLSQGLVGIFPPEPIARDVVEAVLSQLRASVDAKTEEETRSLQTATNDNVRAKMQTRGGSAQDAGSDAATLHGLATRILRLSKDPRRFPIAHRLFAIAFGVEPSSLPDPTDPKTAQKQAQMNSGDASQREPIAGAGQFGIDAAGYSWASMVLGGQAPPPPGIHLLKSGSKEYVAAIAAQQASAVRIYATLAMRGDPQGMLGMGRVLVAGTQRPDPVPGKQGAEAQKDVALMLQRATALWTKAGSLGVGEAYFELGLLALNQSSSGGGGAASPGGGQQEGEKRAREYFALGAEKGDARSHHALAILYTQAAMAINDTAQQSQRDELMKLSMDHFVKAANDGGDAQSAHNVGLRYLLRDELVEEIRQGQVGADGQKASGDGRSDEEVTRQARTRHQALWGVAPDDIEAKKWFQKAAELGSAPGMMNYAGMLVEGRGSEALGALASAGAVAGAPESREDALGTIFDARIMELKAAESLYAKVAAHASVLDQQQRQQAGGDEAGLDAAGKEMGNFAQNAVATVQQLIQKLLDQKAALHQKKA